MTKDDMINEAKISGISPVKPGIFTLPPYDDGSPVLLGGFCPACKSYYFPRPRYCRSCLGSLEEVGIGSEGTLYSFTVVRKKAPLGLPLPYGAGFVDLKKTGLRVFCLLDPAALDKLGVGLPVRLAIGPLGHDGNGSPCLRPFFTPVQPENDPGTGDAGKRGGII